MDDRKRAPNFSMNEKTLLLNLIHQFKDVIENKKTNAKTWRDKDDAWEKITGMFNAQTPETYPRRKEALKKYYDNIKKTVRKQVAEEKKEIFKTGGGKAQYIQNPVKDLALGLMNVKTVRGLSNEFDSDALENIICDESEAGNTDHSYCEDLGSHQVTELGHEHQPVPSCPSTNLNIGPEQNRETKDLLGAKKVKQGQLIHVQTPKTECLRSPWLKRRRPAIQQLPSSKLSEQYLALAKLKMECCQSAKENITAQERREEELFHLQKRKLLIEIQIETEKLQQLQSRNKM